MDAFPHWMAPARCLSFRGVLSYLAAKLIDTQNIHIRLLYIAGSLAALGLYLGGCDAAAVGVPVVFAPMRGC